MKRLVYTVIHRSAPTEPQQETKRFTKQAANHMAALVIDDGGVAAVVEHEEEDIPDITDDASAMAANGRKLVW